MLENDTMDAASTEVMSIRRRNDRKFHMDKSSFEIHRF